MAKTGTAPREAKRQSIRLKKPAEFREEVEFAKLRKALGGGEIAWEIEDDGEHHVLVGKKVS